MVVRNVVGVNFTPRWNGLMKRQHLQSEEPKAKFKDSLKKEYIVSVDDS